MKIHTWATITVFARSTDKTLFMTLEKGSTETTCSVSHQKRLLEALVVREQ